MKIIQQKALQHHNFNAKIRIHIYIGTGALHPPGVWRIEKKIQFKSDIILPKKYNNFTVFVGGGNG